MIQNRFLLLSSSREREWRKKEQIKNVAKMLVWIFNSNQFGPEVGQNPPSLYQKISDLYVLENTSIKRTRTKDKHTRINFVLYYFLKFLRNPSWRPLQVL